MITYYTTKANSQIGNLDCIIRYADGKESHLENYGHHSPDGFQIGYGGSGPADLAFSILTHFFISKGLSSDKAKNMTFEYYQKFKVDFIVPAKTILCINSMDITKWYGDKSSLKSDIFQSLVNEKTEENRKK
ncbi:MAG: hypothetical protein J7L15_08205 [Clostridiales bacterium]|nr:hypothetical protein [Clostridiales bacterium]